MSARESAQAVAEFLQGAIDTLDAPVLGGTGTEQLFGAGWGHLPSNHAIADGYVGLARDAFEKFEGALRG